MDTLSVEDLAWECLRRNPSYQDDARRQLRADDKDSDGDLVVSRRWGLRFRRPSQPLQP
ncbi:transcriptional regulator domain-containing protein [Xaviernesmea oryzae]|nr:DUF6499 domain-containing protein [Xaviernesmea oryzae]